MRNVSGVRWVPGESGLVHIVEHPLWIGRHEDDEGNSIQYA
jgi:hypothetical protein